MLSVRANNGQCCDGWTRREMLRVGGLGACGLSLADLLRGDEARAASGGPAGRAKACIVLFLMGGPPQHSTWDPKPDAPEAIRGAYKPIATNVPGTQFSELLPEVARHADKLAVLRAVSTGDNAHSSSGYYMLTGRPHAPMNAENANPGFPNNWPFYGAVVQRLSPPHAISPVVRLPMRIFNTDGSVWPGQDSGFLGSSADPWLLRCEPASPKFTVPELVLPVEISGDRLLARQNLLERVEQQFAVLGRSRAAERYDYQSQRAFDLLGSSQARQAFDLKQESEATRARYGATQFGQSTLLARRLVEAGVRLVHVNWFRGPEEPSDAPCWDSHARETDRLKKVLCPPLDQALSALLGDLAERGRLDETLVLVSAEFGRTPKFNGNAGRDHWGRVFSVALAGGGVRGGVVYGSSDAIGSDPRDGQIKPEDITATMFHLLGHSPHTELTDPIGRTFSISSGRVIDQILA